MKAFLNYLVIVINVIASLFAIFGITVAPFYLDLTNPTIAVPLAVMLLVVGMYLGYRLREKIADTEIKKEVALKEYEDKKTKEEANLAEKKRLKNSWDQTLSHIRHMDYDKKLFLYAVLAKGHIEIPHLAYSSVDDELLDLYNDGFVDYENCGPKERRWIPAAVSLKVFEAHPELFNDVKKHIDQKYGFDSDDDHVELVDAIAEEKG